MNPMMNPMPFDNSNGSEIPFFSKNGTALSNFERQKIANRKGVCLTCEIRTHETKVFGGKTALTNNDVYQGTCIRCNSSAVPAHILQEWQQRNAPSGSSAPSHHNRFRIAANTVRAAVSTQQQQRPSLGGTPGSVNQRPGSGSSSRRGVVEPLLTAEVSAVGRQNSYHHSHSARDVGDGEQSVGSDASGGSSSRSDHKIGQFIRGVPERAASDMSSAIGTFERTANFAGPQPSLQKQHSSSVPGNSGFGVASSSTDVVASSSVSSSLTSQQKKSSETSSSKVMTTEEYKTNLNVDSFTLLKEIKDNRESPDIIKLKLHGFRNLAADEAGLLHEIRHLIEGFGGNECERDRLVMVALGALWGVCSTEDYKKQEAADTGCLDLVINTMVWHRDDIETLQWALGTLASLALLDNNRSMIAQRGGIERILDALETHAKHATIFEWSCRALYTMITPSEANQNSGSSIPNLESNMVALEGKDGIKIIISAMKQHTDRDPVAEWWALQLVLRLLDRPSESTVNATIQIVEEQDLANTCSKILKARSTTIDLFIAICEMLSVLLSNGAASQQQITVDCLKPLLRFLMADKIDFAVKASCTKVLAFLARGNNQAKRQISEDRCLRMLIETGLNNPKNLELVQNLLFLLCSLSCDDSSFDYSLLGKIKTTIEKCYEAHPDDEGLNSYICDFVSNNASIAEGQPEILPFEVVAKSLSGSSIPEVNRAISIMNSMFPNYLEHDTVFSSEKASRFLENLCNEDLVVQTSSCVSLTALVSASEENRNAIFEQGALTTAAAALMVTDSDILAGCVLELISALVTNTVKKALQLPDEMIICILQAIVRFPELKKLACIAIRNSLLVTVPGFHSIRTEGLVDLLREIIDAPDSSDELLIESCGAIWALCAKQKITKNDLPQLLSSVLMLCASNKGGEDSQFNSLILTEASGALSCIMHCVRDDPIDLPENDIDLIISLLDLAIEFNVENVILMRNLLDVVLSLCGLCKDLLIKFGVIVVVIDCMVEHEGSEIIQQLGCAILAMLASTENLHVNLSIAETDGIDMIVSALAGFSENICIQTDACRALSHLSIDHESRMLISSQGGLILLVNAMTKYPEETNLLEAASSALLNLSSDAEEQVFAGSNAVETIITTMNYHFESTRLQEKCLGILQNVSMRSKDAKKSIAEVGGIEAIIISMKEFMGSPAVMERAFTTLWSLAVLEENQVKIGQAQGIGLIVNGMMANIAYEKVQKQACGCLCTLSTDSRNKTLIRDLGGVDSIVYAMWAHLGSDTLLMEACRALSSLAVNVQTNEVMIATEEEISAIMAAMRRFPKSVRLQEHACVAMRNFMLSADNAALVRPQKAEVEQLMNEAAARYPDRCGDRARQVLHSIDII